MKTVLLALIVFSGTVFIACEFSGTSSFSAPIGSMATEPIGQDFDWPPRVDEPYPDLHLVDQSGNLTRLSEFKGKLILVEPIGLPCPACQAFCGGHQVGGFAGVQPQPDLPSIEEAAQQYGRFDLANEQVVKVYLLLYGMDMKAPTPRDAQAWAKHFGLERSRNEIVLTGLPSMICNESFAMIPGMHLIDRNFVLRLDSTGRANQRHDLYRELLPRVRSLLDRAGNTPRHVAESSR